MCTSQKYEQTPLAATAFEQSAISDSQRAANEYSQSLLELVEDQMTCADGVPLINELLSYWLANPTNCTSEAGNLSKVRRALELSTFLAELRSLNEAIQVNTDYTAE